MKTKIIRKKKISGLIRKNYKGQYSKLKNGNKINRFSRKIQKGGSVNVLSRASTMNINRRGRSKVTFTNPRNKYFGLNTGTSSSNNNENKENTVINIKQTTTIIEDKSKVKSASVNEGKWTTVGNTLENLRFKFECEEFIPQETITIDGYTYNKYQCFPIKRTKGIIKETYSTIYKNIKTGETFKVYENTNQSIGIEYNTVKVYKMYNFSDIRYNLCKNFNIIL